MANVNADYASIKSAADSIREYARQINTELTNVYSDFKALFPADYYGESYMRSAKIFTSCKEALDASIEFFVKTLPTDLETWSNNLKAADKGENAVAAQEDSPVKLEDVNPGQPTTNPIFHGEKIADYRNKLVDVYYVHINNNIDSIESAVDSIVYGDEDDITSDNIGKVKANSNTIRTSIDKVKNKIEEELTAHGVNFKGYEEHSKF